LAEAISTALIIAPVEEMDAIVKAGKVEKVLVLDTSPKANMETLYRYN
jgi:hypothetical protein